MTRAHVKPLLVVYVGVLSACGPRSTSRSHLDSVPGAFHAPESCTAEFSDEPPRPGWWTESCPCPASAHLIGRPPSEGRAVWCLTKSRVKHGAWIAWNESGNAVVELGWFRKGHRWGTWVLGAGTDKRRVRYVAPLAVCVREKDTGSAIANALVVLRTESSHTQIRARTDRFGVAILRDIESGPAKLMALGGAVIEDIELDPDGPAHTTLSVAFTRTSRTSGAHLTQHQARCPRPETR